MTNRKWKHVVLASIGAIALVAGCHKQTGETDAVRTAVRQHLMSIGTLNLQAMEMDFTKIAIDRDRANADVAFRPKGGAPGGAAMQVAYQLEKRGGNWTVVKSEVGGMIQHPAPGANPHQSGPQGSVHGDLPNFKDILGDSNSQSPPPSNLPPGHPPVASSGQSQP